jgi:type II secretion system protein N
MNLKTKIFFYALYAMAAAVFFLYLLFPSQTISALIVERITQGSPDVQVSIRESQPVFPPGLKLEPLSIEYARIPILRMPHLKVMPSLFSMLSDGKQMTFNGPLGHGSLKGNAEFLMDGQRPQTRIIMNLTEVPMEVFEFLRRWPAYQLSGDMTAYLDYDSRKGSGGTTNLKMQVSPTRIVFDPPLLGLAQMDFTLLESEMTLTQRMLQIKRFELSGNQLEGRITGSIVLKQPLEKSRLSLTCTFKPQAAFLAEHKTDMIGNLLGTASAQQRGIIIRIAGTLDNPSYAVR